MGMGQDGSSALMRLFLKQVETPSKFEYQSVVPNVYTPEEYNQQMSRPGPQYIPASFNFNPYTESYQQQFNSMPPVQAPQMPTQPVSGLGALAQLYGMYNAAPQDSASQNAHAASIAATADAAI
jgi:hypothetical protein